MKEWKENEQELKDYHNESNILMKYTTHCGDEKAKQWISENGHTLCPHCNGENSHIHKINIYKPIGDEYQAIKYMYDPECDKPTKISSNKIHALDTGNRSRETGVSVVFKCELCWEYYELGFAFHKGNYSLFQNKIDSIKTKV